MQFDLVRMDNLKSDGFKASAKQEAPIQQNPKTPVKAVSALTVPAALSFARRLSPRAEGLHERSSSKKLARTRKRLDHYQTIDDAVNLLQTSQNIVVLTGAGISTSVGIPDFRSDTGLYEQLSRDLNMTTPEEFFASSFFIERPDLFFQHVKRVIPEAVSLPDGSYISTNPRVVPDKRQSAVPRFSPTHAFLALLQFRGQLLTNYTQNIDGLERAAGLLPANFIQCHGSWDNATCMTCGKSSKAKNYLPVVISGAIPYCKCSQLPALKPKKKRKTKPGQKRKRAASDAWGSDHSSDACDTIVPPRGLLKPDITFFGEAIHSGYDDRLRSDWLKADLLIVIGTSLKVAPVQSILYQLPANIPQIYISKERFSGALCSLPGVQVDIELLGQADVIVEELCRRAGWANLLQRCLWEKGMVKIKNMQPRDIPNSANTAVGNFKHKSKKVKTEKDVDERENNGKLVKESADQQRTQHIAKPSKTDADNVPLVLRAADKRNNSPRHEETVGARTEISPHITSNDDHSKAPIIAELSESRVKIELVEGTTHQWRVTSRD